MHMKNLLYLIQEAHQWYKHTHIHNRNAAHAMAAITLIILLHLLTLL